MKTGDETVPSLSNPQDHQVAHFFRNGNSDSLAHFSPRRESPCEILPS